MQTAGQYKGIENGIKKPIKFPDQIDDGVLLEKDADFDESSE